MSAVEGRAVVACQGLSGPFIANRRPWPSKALLSPLLKDRVYARIKNNFLDSSLENLYTNKNIWNVIWYECRRMGGCWTLRLTIGR